MSEWREVKLGDICTELSDGLHKAPLFVEGGDYIFVNAKNLCDGVIVDNDPTKKTTHEEYLKYSKPLNENTILFSIDGTIGNIARYKGEKCVLGKGACYINPNPVLVDSSYIYFQLQSPHFNSYLNCMSTGSTIKHISLKTMRNYEFTLPPLSEQRSIASILSALDDKIAVNRRICENLEAQAQALFKHWFIDFAPFLDKPSGKAERKNGKFVESELGIIPEGWRVGILGDIAEFKRGKTITKSETKDGTIPVVAGGLEPAYYHNQSNTSSRVITISGSGANAGFTRMYYQPVWASDCSFVDNTATQFLHTAYCYLLTNKKNVDALQWGAAQPHVYAKDINKLPLAIAPLDVLNQFEGMVSSMFDLIDVNDKEIIRLTSLRDTLLPKLMSGQIKV
jgi:type I restriction enzyme S subunit